MESLKVTWVSHNYVLDKKGNAYPFAALYEDGTISVIVCPKCFEGEHKGATHWPSATIYVGDDHYEDIVHEASLRVKGFRVFATNFNHPVIPYQDKDYYTNISIIDILPQADIDRLFGF